MYFFKIFYLGIISLIKLIISLFRYFFIGVYNIITIIPKYFILGIVTIFGKKKRVKSSIQNKKLSFAIASITFAIYLVCVFLISRWYVQGLKIEYLSNDIIITKINVLNYYTFFITDIMNLNNNVINLYNQITSKKVLVINKIEEVLIDKSYENYKVYKLPLLLIKLKLSLKSSDKNYDFIKKLKIKF